MRFADGFAACLNSMAPRAFPCAVSTLPGTASSMRPTRSMRIRYTQFLHRAEDAAFHCTRFAAEDATDLLIREALEAREDEEFPLVIRQFAQGAVEEREILTAGRRIERGGTAARDFRPVQRVPQRFRGEIFGRCPRACCGRSDTSRPQSSPRPLPLRSGRCAGNEAFGGTPRGPDPPPWLARRSCGRRSGRGVGAGSGRSHSCWKDRRAPPLPSVRGPWFGSRCSSFNQEN